MDLLSPDDIRKDRSESAEESQQRSRALAAEESRLARAINQARADADREMEIIETDYREFKREKEEERKILTGDINSLRAQKAELLKPIDKIRENAEILLQEAENRLSIAKKAEANIEADHEKNQDRAEDLQDYADDLNIRSGELDKSELRIKNEDIRILNSAKDLGDKWLEYHDAVNNLNTKTLKVETREGQIIFDTRANEIRKKQQDERDNDLNKKQWALEDGYRNLAKARKEILGRDE